MAILDLAAPATGLVWRLPVAVGAGVEAGDPVVVIESMKMEIPVVAPAAGRVAALLVAGEELVNEGQVVARLETDS